MTEKTKKLQKNKACVSAGLKSVQERSEAVPLGVFHIIRPDGVAIIQYCIAGSAAFKGGRMSIQMNHIDSLGSVNPPGNRLAD